MAVNHRKWVEEQEAHYKSILDKIQYLATFEKYDAKAAVVSKGILMVRSKMPNEAGLVVDRYASCLVCQASSPVMDAHLRSVIVPTLVDLTGATSVVSRHAEVRQRATERLPQVDEVLHGPLDPGAVEIVEDGVRHLVHPLRGQKTGCYLDQRGTRGRVRALAGGRTVLDLYGYQGGMALAALAGGALSAVVIDSSQDALALAQSAATLNGTAERLTVRQSDVTEALAALRAEGSQFGLIVVDPPRLVSGAGQVAGALRFLDKVHRAACRLLAPDGLLVTCSCSPHLREDDLLGVVAQASAAVGLQLRLRERGGLPVDHPVVVSANTPRMDYLTVLILQRI